MSAASRREPAPDFANDPDRFKGLTQRRRERGLPTGAVEVHGPYCPHCARLVPATGTDCPFCHLPYR
jgi:hypothetical protein